jgi:hypothetical protein
MPLKFLRACEFKASKNEGNLINEKAEKSLKAKENRKNVKRL